MKYFIGYLTLITFITTAAFRITHTDVFYLSTAIGYFDEGKYPEAYSIFKRIVEKREGVNSEILEDYYIAGLATGDTAGVVDHLEYFIEAPSMDIETLKAIMTLYIDSGLFRQVIGVCERILLIKPEDRNTRIVFARALHWTGNLEASIKQYKMALGE